MAVGRLSLPLLLVAVMVMMYSPTGLSDVPERVAVPFPLSVKVTPVGKVPFSMKAGAGKPVVNSAAEKAAPWSMVIDPLPLRTLNHPVAQGPLQADSMVGG